MAQAPALSAQRQRIISAAICMILLLIFRSFTYTLKQASTVTHIENPGMINKDAPARIKDPNSSSMQDMVEADEDKSTADPLPPSSSPTKVDINKDIIDKDATETHVRDERAKEARGKKILTAARGRHTAKTKAKNAIKIPLEQIIFHDTPVSVVAQYGSSQKEASKTTASPRDIPVIIISSLRADYLSQVLDAIHPSHQNPNTPDWIQKSPRIILAHKNNNTDYGDRWNDTLRVAQKHNCTVHVFEGLVTGTHPPQDPIRAYYTKMAWYRMMDYLFHTLHLREVFILEDDAVLSHDGLLVAAALFEEHWNRNDTHGISMGGPAGRNKVNATPDAIMAVRPTYFTAMAYSLSNTVFDELWDGFATFQSKLATATHHHINRVENYVSYADWTMEITLRDYIWDLIQLQPSVGRMHHIGIHGMGYDGNGSVHSEFPVPWEFCNATINDDTRTLNDIVLSPKQVADKYGFVCANLSFVEPVCLGMAKDMDHFGPNIVLSDMKAEEQRHKELMAERAAERKARHETVETIKKDKLGTKPKRKVPLVPRKQWIEKSVNTTKRQ